jgi:hypothetical protein
MSAFCVGASDGAPADAPLASANKPAAPNTGMALPLRFCVDNRLPCDIGKTSDRSPFWLEQ